MVEVNEASRCIFLRIGRWRMAKPLQVEGVVAYGCFHGRISCQLQWRPTWSLDSMTFNIFDVDVERPTISAHPPFLESFSQQASSKVDTAK